MVSCRLAKRVAGTYKTSGPVLDHRLSRLTARHATMVEATAAGTLKMTLMIEFKFSNMKIVARRFARKLARSISPKLHLSQVKKKNLRNHKVDQTVLEKEGRELEAAALDAADELVHAEEEDEEV